MVVLQRYYALRGIRNPALRVLLISDALVLISVAMITPIYAVFVARVGGDILDAGLTAAGLAFGSAFAALIAGKYADRLREKKSLLVLSHAVVGLSFLLFITVHSVWYLAAIQVVIGLVRAFADPAFDALYSSHLDKHQEASEWGTWEAMAYSAGGVGAILGGVIVHYGSFSALFVVMAVLCFASAAYVLRVPKRVL
ncbi:MAG TPA: MFS transporter [Candidatus Saccharimonadales bacterium]|nr:MFS transporter [Candidatus Saccharimonadales bacterium]